MWARRMSAASTCFCFCVSIPPLPRRLILTVVPYTRSMRRVGPDIWGLQNRAKGPKYFSKKGYFGHKTGPQKPDVKEIFDVEKHFNSKK